MRGNTTPAGSPTVTHTTTYEYDPETFRLTQLTTTRTSPANTLQALTYVYDPVGNIVALRDGADTGPFFNGSVVNGDGEYIYDALYRLIEATGREHPASQQPTDADSAPSSVLHPNDTQALVRYREQFSYDEVGNIDSIQHTHPLDPGVPGWTRNYDYEDESNQLKATSIPGNELSLTLLYPHDATGSMVSLPHLPTLTWDYAARLIHANRGGGGDVYFTYDASGQRVRKVYVHSSIIEERIYLGASEVYRRRSTAVGASNDLVRETLHVSDDQHRIALVETKTVDTGVVTDPAPLNAPRWRVQVDNLLGSSAIELDESAAVISYEEYHPYGSTAFHSAAGAAETSRKRYRYTGKERDDETGLYYHGARYYAAWLGRWVSADPLGLASPGEADLNMYAYVRGDPVGKVDPTGLDEEDAERARAGAAAGEAAFLASASVGPERELAASPASAEVLGALTPEQRDIRSLRLAAAKAQLELHRGARERAEALARGESQLVADSAFARRRDVAKQIVVEALGLANDEDLSVLIDPTLPSGDAVYQPKRDENGYVTRKATIRLGEGAFTSGKKLLVTLFHEKAHREQHLRDNYAGRNLDPGETPGEGELENPGSYVNEIQAYRAERELSESIGLARSDIGISKRFERLYLEAIEDEAPYYLKDLENDDYSIAPNQKIR